MKKLARTNLEVTMPAVARQNPISDCPLTAAWAAIGGKWKLTIVYWLARQPYHFAALRRQLDIVSSGISQKVLAQQLHELIADGIVARAYRKRSVAGDLFSDGLRQFGTADGGSGSPLGCQTHRARGAVGGR
jgi:DNA-binding HxlR family transcriptional regulator